MAVSERIQEALVKIKKSDFDNALIQTCIAIDATSKKCFRKTVILIDLRNILKKRGLLFGGKYLMGYQMQKVNCFYLSVIKDMFLLKL